MALSEKIEYDKIEVVGNYKFVQVRKCTIVIKDGVEIARSFSRFLLDAGTLDESDNFVDNPLVDIRAVIVIMNKNDNKIKNEIFFWGLFKNQKPKIIGINRKKLTSCIKSIIHELNKTPIIVRPSLGGIKQPKPVLNFSMADFLKNNVVEIIEL